jgi:protein-disulfide isomerase
MLDEKKAQPHERPAQPSAQPGSRVKWIALWIGGGCAVLACAGLVIALAGSALIRRSGHVSNPPTPAVLELPAFTEVAATQAPPTSMQQASNTLGDPGAPVKIVEYADFQCPYCVRYWQDTEPQIIAQYVKTGKVLYEYHSVGAFLGDESAAAAEAAYCAGDQGKFWEYRDALFSHWTGENVGDFTNDKLQQYAATIGLDQTGFDNCLSGGKYADRLNQDVIDAQSAGIRATPSFVINGKLIEGAQPFPVFQEAIEAALQGN